MNPIPARFGAVFLTLLLPLATAPAQTVDGTSPPALNTAVPVASVAPAAPGQPAVGDMLHTDAHGRHLAPHGTLYLLEYVSVKTDKGVEGFEPGQEVRVVEAHRPTHTLVVSDGRAQIEVSPSKLTNDVDIAAAVRLKDQTNQARIAAYVQKEQEAYAKFEHEAAEATAKDVERADKQRAASSVIVDDTARSLNAQPVDTTVASNGSAYNNYYGSGGYGYGSPYSYFPDGGTVVTNVNPAGIPSNNGTAPSNSGVGVNPASQGTAGGGRAAAPGGGSGQNPAATGTAGRAGGR